jgi:hypothetical protein
LLHNGFEFIYISYNAYQFKGLKLWTPNILGKTLGRDPAYRWDWEGNTDLMVRGGEGSSGGSVAVMAAIEEVGIDRWWTAGRAGGGEGLVGRRRGVGGGHWRHEEEDAEVTHSPYRAAGHATGLI